MDFDKLISQRAKKAAALSPEAGERILAAKAKIVAEVEAKPEQGKSKKQDGKRANGWKLRSWFVRPEVANKLKAYVNRRQEAGDEIDASDVVNAAIEDWLNCTDDQS